jgi:hypothetical protein
MNNIIRSQSLWTNPSWVNHVKYGVFVSLCVCHFVYCAHILYVCYFEYVTYDYVFSHIIKGRMN